jgi:hypothetical protein
MSPSEFTYRIGDWTRQRHWRSMQVPPNTAEAGFVLRGTQVVAPRFLATLPIPATDLVPKDDVKWVVAFADRLLEGKWEFLGLARSDMAAPDWFCHPVTARRAPQSEYCFSINHRSESVTGNVKQVWEISRLQHVTVLALAYSLTGDERYAETAASQLRSWWSENPFLSGVNWTSGIELGIRLITWVWVRRLLHEWPGASDLFEKNPSAIAQIWWHQKYLASFQSRGSSANNHVIAEAAGRLVGALAFPWFEESTEWASQARAVLERELANNTFPDGVNREMAFEYHGFVAELGLVAAVESDRAGQPLTEATWRIFSRMLDVIAACLDEGGCAPRYGDGDGGRGFLLGPPDANRWLTLVALGRSVMGAPSWWPDAPADAASCLLSSLAKQRHIEPRPESKPSDFPEPGLTILRTDDSDRPEIWCRCDGGPHGFLAIAAHAHADALSVEVRYGGVEILADPGTYCYHGDERWRSYFRSTIAHNTIEIGGTNQSTSGGPFMWITHARTRRRDMAADAGGSSLTWSAEHDGYSILNPPARHRRTVRLHTDLRQIEILDDLHCDASHPVRTAFHLGPEVTAELDRNLVQLSWLSLERQLATATFLLPVGLSWTLVTGSVDPPLGWYAPTFGEKVPATTILGIGEVAHQMHLTSLLQFHT